MVQKKYTLPLVILIILLLFIFSLPLLSFFTPTVTAQTDWSHISPDIDGDGLPNNVEEAGWCNAVGCFQTNPLDPDGDDDGLTDGEEKLFDANPTSNASPGIYALYEDAFKTKEYYPWQPYGHKMIARGDDFVPPKPDTVDGSTGHGTDLDAIVVRRGTTFYVGGPITGTLTTQKSDASLHNLTIAPQYPFNGQWQVTVPSTSDGTVGKYTLTLGGKSLDIFVIFELPAPVTGLLSQQAIDKFLYDDDPNTIYDDRSVLMAGQTDYYTSYTNPTASWWDGGWPDYTIPSGEFMAEGGVYQFSNHQYNRYILEDYVIPAVNGATNQHEAADKLVEQVDANTAFLNPKVYYNSYNVLMAINSSTDKRNQCSGIAGATTAFNRAAGIPARVLLTDWRYGTFDHSNEVWVDGLWRVYRGYGVVELKTDYVQPNYSGVCASDPGLWPMCRNYRYESQNDWGLYHYRPWHSGGSGSSNTIFAVDESWQSTSVKAYRWPSWITATQYSPATGSNVTARGMSMIRKSYLDTLHTEYWGAWGWTSEPTVTGSTVNGSGDWPEAPGGSAPISTLGANSLESRSAQVQLGDVVSEYGVDRDGDGRYDELVLEVEVNVTQPGSYWLRAQLSATRPDPLLAGTGGVIEEVYLPLTLDAGTHIIPLVYSGQYIALSHVAGPYLLNGLWITDVPDPGPDEFMNESLDTRYQLYTTAPYQLSDFQNNGALLTNTYSHAAGDSDGNGVPDILVLTTGINVYQPGPYTVEATLTDGQDEFVSQAVWSGAGPAVSLEFVDMAGHTGPYTVSELRLLNTAGEEIDAIYRAYTIEDAAIFITPNTASLELQPPGGISALGDTITPTQNISASLVGGNLVVEAEVEVSAAGNYKLEAWLADDNGNLVTWAMGQPASLPTGLQTLSLTFPGKNIRAHGAAGPYQVVALKILDAGVAYDVLDEVLVAVTTPAYTLDQFTAANNIILEDFAESDTGQWLAGSPWAIQEGVHQYFGPSKAWYGSNADASLTLVSPLDFSAETELTLKMQTSYKFGTGEAGYVEVSTDGTNWDVVESFGGDGSWSDEVVLIDLAAYAGESTVYLRFRLDSAGGSSDDGWYIDDLLLAGAGDGIYLPIIVR